MKKISPKFKQCLKRGYHTVKMVGGGTTLVKEQPASDVTYECDCGYQLTRLLDTDKYLKRRYPKKMLLKIK